MKRNRTAQIWGSAAIIAVVLLGTAACSVDGELQLPDRDRLPTLTIPTRDPAPEPDDGGGDVAEPAPPAEPEAPPTEPEAPPAPEPDEPPAAEPDAAPDTEPAVDEPAVDEQLRPWWPLLIVIVLGVTVVIVARARGRAGREWEERFGVASSGVAWTESSLVPQVLAAATATDAAAVWTAARPRVLAIDEQLHTLVTDAAADLNRERAITLREAFTALVSAIDAETTTNPATTADRLRALRIDVDTSRARVRAALLSLKPR